MCTNTQEETSRATITPKDPWPEVRNLEQSRWRQMWSIWTYSYMNELLSKGRRQMEQDGVTHLTQEDLFKVPEAMDSKYLSSLFIKFFEEEKASTRRLLRTLWRLAAPTFVPAGFCQLVTVFAQVSTPLLVRELLRVLEENPDQKVVKKGMPFAILIFVASVVNAFATNRHRHLATKSGIVMRASLVNVIYGNTLKLTPLGRRGLNSGVVTNLVAIDTQKVFEVAQEGHLIWSCPLSMMLVTIFLLIIMGPTTIVGMVVLFLFVPVVQVIASRMLKIRHERVKITDERVETINAMLRGIRVTKLNNYEFKYKARIEDSRNRELVLLKKELFVWAMTLVLTVTSPVLASAATFITYAMIGGDNILTASVTFTVLLLFTALRFPINYVGRLIGKAGQALEATRRIETFLNREIRESDEEEIDEKLSKEFDSIRPILEMNQSAYSVGIQTSPSDAEGVLFSNDGFRLAGISCTVGRGEILAVVGPVGSGKSTLINGIIGEVPAVHGLTVSNTQRVAYASQVPFILNATVRENILFGLPYEKHHYESVLEACCLRLDLKQLGSAEDLTEIGERGVTLSGGQKQRLSLARVAYAKPVLVLCDDPLSALDASTAKTIFERLFCSPSSPLSSSAIVLVTHAAHFLNRVNRLMILVDGQMKFLGKWDELASFDSGSADEATLSAINSIRSSVQEGGNEDFNDKEGENYSVIEILPSVVETTATGRIDDNVGELMTKESRQHGLSQLRIWLLWFKHAGGLPFFSIQVLLMTIDRFAYVGTELWLATWTKGYDKQVDVFGFIFPPQTDGRSAQAKYVGVYAIILGISVLATFGRSEWAVSGGARCAKNVFSSMLGRIVLAPMSYFETTPLGRILNRCTYDIEVVDLTLTESMSVLMIASSWFIAGICIMTAILPWIALALAPITYLYGVMLLHYRKSGADLQRIDALTRSPIQAMVSEGMDGASTIRVYRQRKNFLNRFCVCADTNNAALLNFISAQRWLGIRIELLGSIVVLVSSTMVTSLNDVLKLEPGLVALLIMWSSNFTITLGFFVDAFGESEASITSIERVDAMSTLPTEKSMVTNAEVALKKSWPDRGRVEFDNVCIRYRDGLPLALNGLSFVVEPGKRCGVVGRTGAGKSTLTIALFRLVEPESGRCLIDGVDLSTLGLSDVRGRLGIIPQDPFLFAGTLRECIDPFGSSNDEQILEALQAVRLARKDSGVDFLEGVVEEGGQNYSVGERQLLCLARVLLAKPKVLVMDEATASVDGETDAFIQGMLRTRFVGTTLLTVAHRLNTIMDYDSILVMDKGRAAEFGTPKELLEKAGLFADLVASTGEESARALRDMAFSNSFIEN